MNREEIFNRTALLTGRRNLESFGQTRVIIFGIGGVGSWAAETLVRSGFANLTLVDADRIAMSNINRQLPATTKTVGEVKVEAMKQRLLEINPDARIVAIHDFYNEATQDNYVLTDYDVVIDAIDSLSDKARLILNATKAMAETAGSDRRLHFYSSMGAALKTDPSRIAVRSRPLYDGNSKKADFFRLINSNASTPTSLLPIIPTQRKWPTVREP